MPSSESMPPSKTLLWDPQHNLSRQHNKPFVHLETHIAFDTNNNLSFFLQCKITGSRLARAHNKHSCFPGRAVNYWVPTGKLGKCKDNKTPGAYKIQYRHRGVETEVNFLTASSTASVLASQHPLEWKALTQNLLLKYGQEVQQVKVNQGPVTNSSQGRELPLFFCLVLHKGSRHWPRSQANL